MREYKKRLQTVRSFKTPDEIDNLKTNFDEKYTMLEFDPSVGDEDSFTYSNLDTSGNGYDILINIIELLH